jgi:hypothetical protein
MAYEIVALMVARERNGFHPAQDVLGEFQRLTTKTK